MIVDTTQTKVESDMQLALAVNAPGMWFSSVHTPDSWKVCAPGSPQDRVMKNIAKTDDEREWIRMFNEQWAKTMQDDYGYLIAGER